jgi:hypothetical protein
MPRLAGSLAGAGWKQPGAATAESRRLAPWQCAARRKRAGRPRTAGRSAGRSGGALIGSVAWRLNQQFLAGGRSRQREAGQSHQQRPQPTGFSASHAVFLAKRRRLRIAIEAHTAISRHRPVAAPR